MTRIVVTGAAGFIGTHTVKALLERGYKVIAIDIRPFDPSLTVHEHPKLKLVFCDIVRDEQPSLETLMSKGDKILHLAAVAHYLTQERILDAIRVNVQGTANIALSAIRKKAERIVYSSTGSVYAKGAKVPIREDAKLGPSDDNYYGWSKKQAEEWIKIHGNQLPFIILRYGYVYGALKDWGAIGKWLYHDIPDGKPPTIFGGKQSNDFIYVKDVVQANILALESDRLNQIYNIGTGRATSILNACYFCLKAMKSDIKPKIEPARTFDYPVFLYDISKAEELLGFKPQWNILDGIKDMVKNINGECA